MPKAPAMKKDDAKLSKLDKAAPKGKMPFGKDAKAAPKAAAKGKK